MNEQMRHIIISRCKVARMMKKRKIAVIFLCLVGAALVMMEYLHVVLIPGVSTDLDEEQLQRPLHGLPTNKVITGGRTAQINSSPSYNISETQEVRKRTIRDICASYGADMNSYLTRNLTDVQLSGLSCLHVVPKFKILYCAVPKVGCTSWKRLILNLTGYDDVLANLEKEESALPVHDAMQHFFRPLSKFDPDRARDILKSYKAFMFVRNPYTRVLSAFRDKIIMDRHSKWRDEMLEWMVTEDPQAAADVFLGKRNFTFEEFLKFYLSPVNNNPHWREYYRLCLPCVVNYDFIGKFERMSKDSSYVLKNLFHVNSSVGLSMSKRITNSSSSETFRRFYSSVQRDLLHRISQHGGFTIDSKLFGYDAPEVIQELLH